MDSKKGSLTIEASISLTAFIFIVVMVISFIIVYKAQGIVSHATLQASQSLAIESYYRETMSDTDIVKMISFVEAIGLINEQSHGYDSLGESNLYAAVKEAFVYAIAENEKAADKALKNAGIENGLSGIDFTYSSVSNSNIIVNARYKVNLPFSFFGKKTVTLSKSAKTKSFKTIDDDNGYKETSAPAPGSS